MTTHNTSVTNRTGSKRRGVVLVIVLVVVVILALAAYTFCALMIAQHDAANWGGRQIQSRALVDSGVESVRLFLAQDEATQLEAGGIYDNPAAFRGIVVVDDEDPELWGSFTVLAPALDDEGHVGGVRYGLEDESARLNLNALMLAEKQQEGNGRALLLALPGMTEEIADAILDWIDDDDEPREFGAEVDYYSALNPPYAPKNGPLESVEELLLVRGVDPYLLFGFDQNRNGIIDPHETSGTSAAGASGALYDNSDGSLDRGWSSYLTLYSKEKNFNAQGKPRVYLNTDDMEQLYKDLGEVLDDEWATFIVAYRQNGPYSGSVVSKFAGGKLDLTKPGQFPLVQVLDLVGQAVNVTFQGASAPFPLTSPIQEDNLAETLPLLMDNVTTVEGKMIPGRININQAPREILAGIPGLEDDVLDQIITARANAAEEADVPEDENRKFETWILADGIVNLDTMRTLLPFVCVGGDVYRAQVVGFYQGGGAASRAEVVFDATAPLPRILFWRDISHLGRGYALETLGAELLDIP